MVVVVLVVVLAVEVVARGVSLSRQRKGNSSPANARVKATTKYPPKTRRATEARNWTNCVPSVVTAPRSRT